MFNIKSIRAIYTDLVFNPTVKVRKTSALKDESIKLIMNEIKRNKSINRLMLLKKTGMSKSCLMKVLSYLFEADKITRKEIGKYGGNTLYSYSAIKAE